MLEKFVFSNDLKYRITRHLAYWAFFIFFILHYTFNDFLDFGNVIKIMEYLPYDIISTYFLLLFIVPRVLKKDKFLNLLFYFILLVIIDFMVNEFVEFLRTGKLSNYFDNYWTEIVYGMEFSAVLYAIPLTIKVIKYYYSNAIKMYELEQLNQENQIKMLTEQLNPHFLFNAFATIRALIGENNDSAKKVIDEMSEYFRYSLIGNKKECSTLKEEINIVKSYLEIQKIRFKSDINVNYIIDDETIHIKVPFLSVQTLVENAIKYGTKHNGSPLEIIVKSKLKDKELKISVVNSGNIQENSNNECSTKMGLTNLKKRLDVLYPHKNSFKLFEDDNKVYAVISINYL